MWVRFPLRLQILRLAVIKLYINTLILLFGSFLSYAQNDSTKTLDELIIKAFETKQTLFETPASVAKVSYKEIKRFENSSPLPLLNALPGVKMEERSPSSYRLSMRGSSIRSPFGVRNVKIYWNNIPLSDANGNTYLNQVDFNTLGSIEIIKGPASSIYGGSYGGVVNLNTPTASAGHTLRNSFQVGSYATVSENLSYGFASEKLNLFVSPSISSSDGYREHSGSTKKSLTLGSHYFINRKHSIDISLLLSSLDYKTPGGLNLKQMQENRRQSRLATATLPSAKAQNARISQNLSLVGLSHNWAIDSKIQITTTLYSSKNKLSNPFITNYEDREEQTLGYRTVANYTIHHKLNFVLGSEGIFTDSYFKVYDNLGGVRGPEQYQATLSSKQLSHFIQLKYALPWQISITTGLSYNQQAYKQEINQAIINDSPKVPWSLRIAVLKTFHDNWSMFYTFSNGYSPPTSEEILTNYKNAPLKAEIGVNNEIGLRYRPNSHYLLNIAFYKQVVKNALVRNVLESGDEYFENTGKILQKGIEVSNAFSYILKSGFFSQIDLKANLTFNDFTFANYINDKVDFSGKTLPGTSKINTYISGSFIQRAGFYLNLDLNYFSQMPLNSQNTVFAESTWLSTARLGWEFSRKSLFFNLYTGVNNIFNKEYSLGYDFNAFGGRLYNPAPNINYNTGFSIGLNL